MSATSWEAVVTLGDQLGDEHADRPDERVTDGGDTAGEVRPHPGFEAASAVADATVRQRTDNYRIPLRTE